MKILSKTTPEDWKLFSILVRWFISFRHKKRFQRNWPSSVFRFQSQLNYIRLSGEGFMIVFDNVFIKFRSMLWSIRSVHIAKRRNSWEKFLRQMQPESRKLFAICALSTASQMCFRNFLIICLTFLPDSAVAGNHASCMCNCRWGSDRNTFNNILGSEFDVD